MTGPIALHGGGEFLPGDEPFLDALLESAALVAADRGRRSPAPIHVVVLPAAAARHAPDRAAAFGVAAFEQRARVTGRHVAIDVARVIDRASSDDPHVAEVIASADLVYLPGGDPDLIPALLGPSAAGRALAAAHRNGALIAGASAGAMGLADWTWTPQGGIPGLGLIHGLIVVPHYDDIQRMAWQTRLEAVAPAGLGYLGLDERTGVISGDGTWRVVGEGAAHWFAPRGATPIVARHDELLDLVTEPGPAAIPSPAARRRCR
jgi:cyanophycinase